MPEEEEMADHLLEMKGRENFVGSLRFLSDRVAEVPGTIYLPPPEGKEPRLLGHYGYRPFKEIAEILHYIADMVEE